MILPLNAVFILREREKKKLTTLHFIIYFVNIHTAYDFGPCNHKSAVAIFDGLLIGPQYGQI